MKTFKKTILFVILFTGFTLAAQTQLQMNQQAQQNYLKADKTLNNVYKQLLNMLGKEQKALLIKTQKDWIKFRDSHCQFETKDYEGGSMRPMVYSDCLQHLTEQRTKDLRQSIKSRANK